jgi:hypothetical protein
VVGGLPIGRLAEHQAALVRPGAFLQLINHSTFPCRALYIVGPAYVFDVDDQGKPLFDDAITLDETWDELAALNWLPPALRDANLTTESRDAAINRIRGNVT